MNATKPFFNNGKRRKSGNMAEFMQFADLFQRMTATLLPYERPRLAAVTINEAKSIDEENYASLHDMRDKLVKMGLPIDHLLIEHDAGTGSQPEP